MDDSYIESQDTAVTVKFEISDGDFKGAHLLAWTTTPWTVPMHMAIAVNQSKTYALVQSD